MYNDEKGTSILMVVVKKENLWKVVDTVNDKLNTKLIILKSSNTLYEDFFFVMFEAVASELTNEDFNFTVVHKKGKCYYTINALNKLIMEQLGYIDKEYVINWDDYQNSIIFLDKQQQLIKVDTKIYRVMRKK